MALGIEIVRVWARPQDVYVQWTYTPNAGVTGVFTFNIARSESPEGPWTLVGSAPNSVTFVDALSGNAESTNTLSIARSIYYRVTVTDPNGRVAVSMPMGLDGQRAKDTKQLVLRKGESLGKRKILLRRKAIRDAFLTFKLNGIAIAVLKRRHYGVRCTVCYDQLTKMSTKSRCPVCFGTSWVGGYHTPIVTYGKVSPSSIHDQIATEGGTEMNSTRVILPFYPLVEPEDVLVEVDSNTRWVIKDVNSTELKRLAVHQSLVVVELPRTAAEYNVPIPETL